VCGLSANAWVPIIVLFAALATDLWVYVDAKVRYERGTPVIFSMGSLKMDTPAAWFFGCLILWIVFFPLYIMSRDGSAG
jgi:hypothetical protein